MRTRVQQTLRLMEQTAVERTFAGRLLDDASAAPTPPGDIRAALSHIEVEFARTNTLGFIHLSPALLVRAQAANQIVRSGSALKTVSGHMFVVGGGYADGLGDTIVATSPTFGYRDQVQVRDATGLSSNNVYAAIAERSVVVVYEKAVASAAVAVGS